MGRHPHHRSSLPLKQIRPPICKKKRKMSSYRRTIRMTAAPPLAGGALKLQGDDIHGYHSIQIEEEQVAFAGWLNRLLKDDKEVAHLLPIAEEGCDMYGKIDDGIILCKVVNFACPGTIDHRAINKGSDLTTFHKHENITLAVQSAKSIGITVINMDSHSLSSTGNKKWLVIGLLWQLIEMYLFKEITLSWCFSACPTRRTRTCANSPTRRCSSDGSTTTWRRLAVVVVRGTSPATSRTARSTPNCSARSLLLILVWTRALWRKDFWGREPRRCCAKRTRWDAGSLSPPRMLKMATNVSTLPSVQTYSTSILDFASRRWKLATWACPPEKTSN